MNEKMERKIAFRAWDKIHKDIKEVALINWVEGTVLLWSLSDSVRVTIERRLNDVILLQYTGKNDNKRTEKYPEGEMIYEGYVVHCIAEWDTANMVVIFEEGEFRMVLCTKYKTYVTGGGFYAIGCFKKNVIGSIHDNPELLVEIDKDKNGGV